MKSSKIEWGVKGARHGLLDVKLCVRGLFSDNLTYTIQLCWTRANFNKENTQETDEIK